MNIGQSKQHFNLSEEYVYQAQHYQGGSQIRQEFKRYYHRCEAVISGEAVKVRGTQTFSVKGQTVNISGFMGHMVSDVTTELCH